MPYEYHQSTTIDDQTQITTFTGTRPLSEVLRYDYIPDHEKLTILKPLESSTTIVGSNVTEYDDEMKEVLSEKIVPEEDLQIKS